MAVARISWFPSPARRPPSPRPARGYAAPRGPSGVARPNRQVLLVAALFAVAGTMATVVVASSASVGKELSGGDRLATVPIALGLTGGVLGTFPASKAMARWGRRAGFQAFTAIGLAGALVQVAALQRHDFWLFCGGSVLVGAMGGSAQYYRFAAGEVADEGAREKALGYVLAAGVVGGLLGPQSAAWAADAFATPYAGTYLVVALLAVVALLLLPFLRAPAPAAEGAPRARLRADRPFVAAVLAGALAYGGMVLTMYAAPLSLHDHGHGFSTAAHVLQAHVVAMFLPSFVTGGLVQRVGPAKGMAAGLGLFGLTAVANLAGQALANYYVALVLLGLGWNLLFVSATALLARTHGGADKASAQGVNEVLVGAASAGAAFLAGPVHAAVGWETLNLAVAAAMAAGALALVALLGRPGAAKPAASQAVP
jgi:MFS family permease